MESMGVVVRRYIDFLIFLIPTPLVSALFCSIPYFLLCFSFFIAQVNWVQWYGMQALLLHTINT